MLPDLQKLFETQAAWQRTRVQLPWPEKIRMAELMREAARTLRGESAGFTERAARGAMPPTTEPGMDALAGPRADPTVCPRASFP